MSIRMRCTYLFFFFSSRRRHTRSDRDWSSDVCSSDLDTLTASPLDYVWFMRGMTEKTLKRLAVAVDDRRNIVMTAPTSEIRRWLPGAPAPPLSAARPLTRQRCLAAPQRHAGLSTSPTGAAHPGRRA